MLSQADYEEVLQMRREFAVLRLDWMRIVHDYFGRKYSPDQPRVPAGSREGGQWTTDGGGGALAGDGSAGTGAGRVRLADAGSISDSRVMSDATPDPIVPGAQYAQSEIVIHTDALTGISTIDDTTKQLASTLATVKDVVEYGPELSPQSYGTLVHLGFAAAVNLQNLPGVEVETTFGGDYYGSKGSIRTDVVLRNEVGDIIAIYDVKTGEAGISATRAAEIRDKTGVDRSVPIIQLSIPYGVTRKSILSGAGWSIHAVM